MNIIVLNRKITYFDKLICNEIVFIYAYIIFASHYDYKPKLIFCLLSITLAPFIALKYAYVYRM